MVDIGFFDLLLDIELFNQEVDRISKDSIPSEEMEISQLVGNWNKDRPSGTAILPQHEYYKYKVQEFERAFGNILKTIIAAPGG